MGRDRLYHRVRRFILTAGALGDRLGAKRIFMAGLRSSRGVARLRAGAVGGVPDRRRSVQGLAAAILVPNSLTLLNHAYADPKERGRAVGFWAAGASVALTAGPFVGGVANRAVGWRSIFLVNLRSAPPASGSPGVMPRRRRGSPQREIDLPGQIAAITALGNAGRRPDRGRQARLEPSLVIVGFAAAGRGRTSVRCGARRARHNRCSRSRCLPIACSRSPRWSVLFNIAFYGLIFVLSLYFQISVGWSPFATGLAFVPMMAMVLPANLVAASVSERLGAPQTIALASVITAVGCVALLPMASDTSYWAIGAQLLVLGGGSPARAALDLDAARQCR